ncbi:hypothetical protein D3C83_10250 [compost metagenome]
MRRAARIDEALRYAMSLDVCTTVSGIDSPAVLRRNVHIARNFVAMTPRQRQSYERSLADVAADGRFELYKTTAEHDGDVGRGQHGFPSQADMAS